MKDYVKQAVRTDAVDIEGIKNRLFITKNIRILHALMGLTTETGEAMDAMKKHLIYGKYLDITNLQEELGDIFWYCALLADACDFTFEDTMEKNIAKLRARYPDRFTEFDALNRNLEVERKILEDKFPGNREFKE